MSFVSLDSDEFTKILSSKSPVPGGGGASALVGAVGVSLGNMVGSLTEGKKKYADVADDIERLMLEGESLRKKLLELIDRDAEAFEPLSKAYAIPKDNPQRGEIMENALNTACSAPLEIMKTAAHGIDLLEEYAEKGSRLALSDAGVGVLFLKSAIQGASLNVFINTKSMTDKNNALQIEKQADEILDIYCEKADRVYESVTKALRNREE